MDTKHRALTWWPLIAIGILALLAPLGAPAQAQAQAAPQAQTLATHVTLDQAIDLALKHNHSLQAARTMILQNQAQEITANLRPNPVLARGRAVSADFSAEQLHERLPGQQRAIRFGRRVLVRAREEAAASLAGGQGPDGRDVGARWRTTSGR